MTTDACTRIALLVVTFREVEQLRQLAEEQVERARPGTGRRLVGVSTLARAAAAAHSSKSTNAPTVWLAIREQCRRGCFIARSNFIDGVTSP